MIKKTGVYPISVNNLVLSLIHFFYTVDNTLTNINNKKDKLY